MTGLWQPVLQLSGWGQEWAGAALLVFLRVGAVMAVMPGFGEQTVPMRVRLALTLAFAAVVLPAVGHRIEAADPLANGGAEIAIGLMLGLGLRLFVLALATAGAIAAQAASLSQLFAGAGAEPQPALGHLFTVAGLAIAMAAGLHVKAAALLILSYDLLPAGQMPPAPEAAEWGTGLVSDVFALAFSLAAPFVLASMVYNLALGVINRAMPQLMVAFIGAPALTAGGLVLLALAAAPALAHWLVALDRFLTLPLGGGG